MRRRCGCGHATTASPPAGVRGGPTCYGPNVTAAATLLAGQDVLGIERTADLMSALLGVEVSTGFISSCLTRLDTALTTAGFEQALKTALREQEVLGTDETPAPLTGAAGNEPDCHNPHVYTVRTMGAYTGGGADLVWYGAAGEPHQGLDQRVRDPRRLPWGAGPRRLRRLHRLRRPTWPGSSNAWPTCCATSTTRTPSTPTPRPGPARSPTPCAGRSTRSTPPGPPTAPPSTPSCSPGCAAATTGAWPSGLGCPALFG